MHSTSPSQALTAGSKHSGATILVVDDYRSLCNVIAGMLRPRGYRVLTAASGEEAKALARENGAIDLLLTDLEMPEMRGDELAAWFHSANYGTQIIFMSSGRTAIHAPEPFHFLQKPLRAEALLGKVREVLSQKPASVPESRIPASHGN